MVTPPKESQQAATPSKGAVSIPSKTPSIKHFRGGIVTIIVGAAKKQFAVHKDLLMFYSDYFRAALNGSFIEATEKKINLVDTEPELFELFYTWVYARELADEDDESLDWEDLIDLWVFGDRYQIPMLQNCVMDEFFAKEKRENGYQLHIIKLLYEKTMSGSLLRKGMIELLVYKTELGSGEDSSMDADDGQWYTFEILQDIIRELHTARQSKFPYPNGPKRNKCFFHVHGKDEHC